MATTLLSFGHFMSSGPERGLVLLASVRLLDRKAQAQRSRSRVWAGAILMAAAETFRRLSPYRAGTALVSAVFALLLVAAFSARRSSAQNATLAALAAGLAALGAAVPAFDPVTWVAHLISWLPIVALSRRALWRAVPRAALLTSAVEFLAPSPWEWISHGAAAIFYYALFVAVPVKFGPHVAAVLAATSSFPTRFPAAWVPLEFALLAVLAWCSAPSNESVLHFPPFPPFDDPEVNSSDGEENEENETVVLYGRDIVRTRRLPVATTPLSRDRLREIMYFMDQDATYALLAWSVQLLSTFLRP